MYLVHRLRDIYECLAPKSIESNIAKYVLLNLNRIEKLSLTDISKNTSTSKSAVSNFISSLSNDQGFSLFKNTLIRDVNQITFEKNVLLQQAEDFHDKLSASLDSFSIKQLINDEEIKALAKRINQCDRIVFVGNTTKKSYFNIFIDYLLLNKKDVRFLNYHFPSQTEIECLGLDENDLLILVEPYHSFYEFTLLVDVSIDTQLDLDSVRCHKVFVGKHSSSNEEIETVSIKNTKNLFMNNVILEYFVSQLLYYYIKTIKSSDVK